MNKFEAGQRYGVLHMHDQPDSVVVAARTDHQVTLADGRIARIVHGQSPDGGTEEVLRLDEQGAVAVGGVVRVCQRRPWCGAVAFEESAGRVAA